jgi:hypothetical protein
MPIRSFTTVPKDPREWGKFFRETTVTADVVAPDTVDTAMLIDGAVTDAKLRDSSPLSVIGRPVNSTGDPSNIAAANDGEVLRRSGAVLGFGTLATAGIADNAVTDGKLRDSAALSVMGRSANSTGDPADIAAANDGEVLRRSGTALGFGTVATAGIADDAVTNAKLANMADSTIKGRTSGAGTGDPVDLTAAQVATIVATAVASALNLTASTYTPTLTNVTNLDSSTVLNGYYVRVGNIVVAAGAALVDATTNGLATELGISLPVASNFSSAFGFDVAGAAGSNTINQSGAIIGDATNDRARLQYIAQSAAAQVMWWVFMYAVI